MLDFASSFDRDVLHKINAEWVSPWANWFFPLLTDFNKSFVFQWVVIPVAIATILFHYRLKSVWIFLGVAVVLLISDWGAGHLLRSHIDRLRPFMTEPGIVARAPTFGDRSFPSLHASNVMGLAVFFGAFFPIGEIFFVLIALTVGYSRVYCGVHWPTDVLFGFLIGWGAAQVGLALLPPSVFGEDQPFVSRLRHGKKLRRR